MRKCLTCNKELNIRQKSYCSKRCIFLSDDIKNKRKEKEKLDHTLNVKCKIDNKCFKDYKNISGALTRHLKSLNIETSDIFSYFDIVKVEETKKWHCPYCQWTSKDIKNISGWITTHIKKHNITISEHIKKYPNDSDLWIYSSKSEIKDAIFEKDDNSYIKCLECGDKFKRLTISHLKLHGLTLQEYRDKYSIENLTSNNTREILKTNYFTNFDIINVKIRRSKIEKELYDLLVSHGIKVQTNINTIISPQELDIYLPEYKLAIEINGLYWHSEYSGKKHKNYHLDKLDACEKNGIQLMHIFDDDWYNKKDIIVKKILSKIKKDDIIIYARKCKIKELSPKDKSNFLNLYHIQGDDRAKIKLGLFYDEELVSVMTFGDLRKSLGQNKVIGTYELVRFATKYTVIGGASKLLTYFIKSYKPDKIISYADRRFTTLTRPSLYDSLGFTLTNITKPNYWYTKDYRFKLHRYNFNKSRLVNEFGANKDKTEKSIMFDLGYDRIWDCGNLKYELTITK